MVKAMCKETVKAGKRPTMLIVLWFIFIYVFYIGWGITEILIEAKAPFYVKHIILFGISTFLVWKIIQKFITEYEFTANKSEFTAIRKLGRKEKLICTIKYKNIDAIYTNDEKENIKKHVINKKFNFTRAYQNGKQLHIIYKFDSKVTLVTLTMSRRMAKLIRDYYEEAEGQEL